MLSNKLYILHSMRKIHFRTKSNYKCLFHYLVQIKNISICPITYNSYSDKISSYIFKILLTLCGLILLLTLFSCNEKNSYPTIKQSSKIENSAEITKKINSNFFDKNSFYTSISEAKSYSTDFKKLRGGIVPHHLLANNIISSFFKSLSLEQPYGIILIGPNHNSLGNHCAITSLDSFNTPFGDLDPDNEVIEALLQNNFFENNSDILEKDHSINALVPYIKYYFPNTKIIPLALLGNINIRDLEFFSNLLFENTKEKNYLFVSSVDFSHYLSLDIANTNDNLTLELIKNKNINQIDILNSDFLDSPPSIISQILYLNKFNDSKFQLLDHSNSAILSNNLNSPSTTSYFSILYGN